MLFIPLIITDPFSCCHGELLLLSYTPARAKIIGVIKIQSCRMFPAYWRFHLKRHTWVSACICDAAAEENESDRKTMLNCATAKPHEQPLSVFFYHSHRLFFFFNLALLCIISIEPLKKEDSEPIIVKINETIGV